MFRSQLVSGAARGVTFGILLIVGVQLAGCASTAGGPAPANVAAGPREVKIFYATTRSPSASAGQYFGRDRGDLSFGVAAVGIPSNHRIGRNEQPSVFRFEWSEDERKHIALRGIEALQPNGFRERLTTAIDAAPGHKIMVFVHGYNVSFSQATRALAQFATDLKFDGPVLLFSWPSQGTLTGYAIDATNVEWSQPQLTLVLEDLLEHTPAGQIYLIAHSMGSRALTRAHNTITSERPLEVYGALHQMILVAPDVDADLFRQDIAPRLARSGIQVTLYASSADRALLASKAFNGYARAGDSGRGLVIVPGVETVDASDASGGLLGHSYFAEDRRIMEDIFAILQTGQRADQRFGLQAVDAAQGRYWTFRR